jgi:glycosyltransferase involved in cell wall biosynthesis
MPLVATAVGGIPEIVRNEESGLLVSDGDGFVRAVLRLVDDVALRSTLGARARVLAESEYSLERSTEMLTSFYEGLVA